MCAHTGGQEAGERTRCVKEKRGARGWGETGWGKETLRAEGEAGSGQGRIKEKGPVPSLSAQESGLLCKDAFSSLALAPSLRLRLLSPGTHLFLAGSAVGCLWVSNGPEIPASSWSSPHEGPQTAPGMQ